MQSHDYINEERRGAPETYETIEIENNNRSPPPNPITSINLPHNRNVMRTNQVNSTLVTITVPKYLASILGILHLLIIVSLNLKQSCKNHKILFEGIFNSMLDFDRIFWSQSHCWLVFLHFNLEMKLLYILSDSRYVLATLVVLYLDDLFLFCAVTLNIIEIAILIFYLFLIKKDNLTALASLTLSVNDWIECIFKKRLFFNLIVSSQGYFLCFPIFCIGNSIC